MRFTFIALLALSALILPGCSTCKCKSIDDQGKIRDASDPAPEAPTTPPAPAAPADLPAVVPNSGTSTLAAETSAPAPTPTANSPTPPMASEPPKTTATGTDSTVSATVRVYKYDNSRQCGQGKALELDEMAKQLKNIKIISQEKKNDGMMRIQMCGAPTGIANVYEIDRKDLKKALKVGFREWKYSPQ